ncbi:MAG: NAD(P)H-dependent oxidoreductase, partial [Clostridium sp.]|nr:NAD(P)H-dependent oxidoreductase [Clostridium sp.]
MTHLLLTKLRLKNAEIQEFYFPHQLDCRGCNQCFYKSELNCPDAEEIQPIIASLDDAELIIVESPCYCMGMTGSLKCFLDHLAYMWLSHRPHPQMFHKVGVVLSCCGGAGAKRVTKDLAEHLMCWGIPQIYQFPMILNSPDWESIPSEIMSKLEHTADRLAPKITKALSHPHSTFKSRYIFKMMQKNQKQNVWNPLDKTYWQETG